MTRIVHYLNQFFAGIGGEEAAAIEPGWVAGATGPGRRLQQLLGDSAEIVATVFCGDDHAAGSPAAADRILDLALAHQPDLVVAGPAFASGRYGLACARVAAAATRAAVPAVASMHDDNPGLHEAAGAVVVRSGAVAREMAASLDVLAEAVRLVLGGEPVTRHRVGRAARRNVLVERSAAERAVDLALARLAGQARSEVPLPEFDRVQPAAPVDDLTRATVALITEGGLVPDGNPDAIESARATRWSRCDIDALDSLPVGRYGSVHGGFATTWANEDPQRIVPLDAARELEREGVIGRLHHEYLVTVGNGTAVDVARTFGVEWAALLRRQQVAAAVLTAT